MGYADAPFVDGDDGGTILPILIVILFSYFLTKFLKNVGIVTSKNYDFYTKLVSASVGIFYATSMDVQKSFGPFFDFIILCLAGAFVGYLFWWIFIFGSSHFFDN